MKHNLKFPGNYCGDGKVGKEHWLFAKNLVRACKDFTVQEIRTSRAEWPTFYVNDKKCIFDYYDWDGLNPKAGEVDFCFKTQHTEKSKRENTASWSQISFMDFSRIPDVKYRAESDLILNNQRPYRNATERRKDVQSLLKKEYRNNVDITIHSQEKFYSLVNSCLTYVHVPGYTNNMIDRAHVQMFALGCCMITTHIPTLFPNDLRPISGTHYVQCADDYSDLCEKIEWIRNNKEEAIQIGRNAKELFNNSLTPDAFSKHLITCLNL